MTSVHVTLWQTNNSIHFLTWGSPVTHGGRKNMELRHLQFLTWVRQSTGNRRLDIWWQRNESFLLLPCQGKCPKSKRVKLTFVYLFVCLLTKLSCEHCVWTHSPSGVFCLVEQIIWVLTEEWKGFYENPEEGKMFIRIFQSELRWTDSLTEWHTFGCGLNDTLPAQFKCQFCLSITVKNDDVWAHGRLQAVQAWMLTRT